MCFIAQLANASRFSLQDLGSSPRSEQFPYYFCILIPMQCSQWKTPYSLTIRQPRVPWDQAKGKDWESIMYHSQRTCMCLAKVKWTQINGPDLSKFNLHIGVWNPPGLQFSIFFLYFIFNYCIIFFIVLI